MPPPEQQPGRAVLVVCEIPFWREETGAHQRIARLCRALDRAGFRPAVFYATRLTAEDRRRLRAGFSGLDVAHPSWPLLLLRRLRRTLGLFRRAASPGAQPLAWERRWALRRWCRAHRPRFVLVEYLWSAYLAEGLRAAVPQPPLLLLDTIDVMHLRGARFAERGMDGAPEISRVEEAAVLSRFDALLAIQEEEAKELRAMCPGTPVITVGHALDARPPQSKPAPPVRVFFLGGGGAHNQAAITGFLDSVWPPVRAAHGPEAELHIAGLVCDTLDAAALPEGVVLRGFVRDLDALYAEAHIVVNPVHAGSGLKVKNVEALCHAVPLVTTPTGAEGLETGADAAFLVCRTPEDMAAELDRLICGAEVRNALANAAWQFARDHLGEPAAYGALLEFLCAHQNTSGA